MTVEFVVPSFRRPVECMRRTVRLLAENGIRPTVYLSDPDEMDAYAGAARDEGLESSVTLRPGVAGLPHNRNHIRRLCPEGTYFVSMDDDVSSVSRLAPNGKRLLPVNLAQLIQEAEAFCRKRDITLWGVYPVANHFFMSNRVRVGNYFVGGAIYMERSFHDAAYDVQTDFPGTRDDIERTLIHDDLGRVARFEFVTHQTDYLKLAGGLQAGVRDEDAHVDWILKTWPHKTKGWQRKDGRREIKLLAGKEA